MIDVEAALSQPSTAMWHRFVAAFDEHWNEEDVKAAASLLRSWPREVPRPTPKHWRNHPFGQRLLRLCLDVEEEDTYPLYETAAGTSPLLRRGDGGSACSLWRQPSGVVELASGATMTLGAGQPGLADLGGWLAITGEWGRQRLLYVEVEVKLCGKIPPGAAEYVGSSRRQLTATEERQVQRQRAVTSQGGCYIFVDRVESMVSALSRHSEAVENRIKELP